MELNCNNQLGPTDRGAWRENTPNNQLDPAYRGADRVSTNNQVITDLYMQDGDDYLIDDNAFSEAQIGTGDNSTAASVSGSSSGGASETNSNVNTGVFGGTAHAAKPGQSLWK